MNATPRPHPSPSDKAAADMAGTPLSQLVNEHAALGRWLNLPGAELWPEHAEKEARELAIWGEIQRRLGKQERAAA